MVKSYNWIISFCPFQNVSQQVANSPALMHLGLAEEGE